MHVRFGECDYEFPSDELRELRDSSDLLGDRDALQARCNEDGYLYFRGLINRDKVLRSRATILAYMDEQGALTPGEPVLEGVMPQGGRAAATMGKRQITHHPDVQPTLEAQELFAFYERYFDEPARTFDYKWLRGVGNQQFTGCHYDVVYMGRGSQRLMTSWIPLGDIPIEMGTLCICVGSHNLPGFEKVRQTYGRMDVDRDLITGWFSRDPREITQKFGGYWATTHFQAGDVITFGMYTMHASTVNRTNRWRLSCDVRFQPAADPVDDRWVGANPKSHYKWQAPESKDKLIPIEVSRAEWGV